jgi:hypothetical protein
MACLPTVGRHGLVVAQPDERLVHAGRDVLQAQAHVVDQRTNHDDGEENGRRQSEGDRGETVRGELHRAARGGRTGRTILRSPVWDEMAIWPRLLPGLLEQSLAARLHVLQRLLRTGLTGERAVHPPTRPRCRRRE